MTPVPSSHWSVQESAELYGVPDWGTPHFRLSDNGEVQVNLGDQGAPNWNSIPEIMRELDERGIAAPLMLRFGNILDHRITLINESFRSAIKASGYQGKFRGVFPIKVNQQQQVIEEICRFGKRYHHGLEAGSKPELITALSHMHDPEGLIVCNGYKDAEFIDLALYGLKMGLQVMLVAETPKEIGLILQRSKTLGIRPRLGVRMKLSTPGEGKWVESGGDQSVFGLDAEQVIDVVDQLRAADALDCLELLHYHLGSQIPAIRTIRSGVSEATRVYIDLLREGAAMGFLDIGGGLAVDYDGTQSSSSSSRNYSVSEYCADVVDAVMSACDEAKVAHPHIVTESGRATVAHYGVLVFDILDVNESCSARSLPDLPREATPSLRNLHELYNLVKPETLQECYNDAVYYRDQLRAKFTFGLATLRERALGEKIFNLTIRRIAEATRGLDWIPDSLKELPSSRPDIYYGNFSLFQSLPDAWAIDQLFPIMPIHRLEERPDREGVFADITCDCDGKIDHFIDSGSSKKSLPLHALNGDDPYFIGVFLVGAYQETLGDLHNLFGDTNVVSVELDENGSRAYGHEVEGDTVADVLTYVEYDPKDLAMNFRSLAERAVRSGHITAAERKTIVEAYNNGMRGYTYFET